MKINGARRLKQAWAGISRREQALLLGLAGLLLVVVGYGAIWRPTGQRLEVAERQYRQQAELNVRIQRAEPARDTPTVTRPLSVRLNDSATAAGLDIAEMDVDGDAVRLTVTGDANPLLLWLDRHERDGAALQALTLEVRDGVLEARVVLAQ
ncbi:type II secretion system protein GspM [Pseudomonas citrulli]|uniref:Type II secretion system protein GspM n=1 Tax=Pseudomonas citrulli TaxID=3064347 RepID=A0ABT9BZD3_9PSED|nr:type II secretion system protein GspM [Pseudomonas sp. K18]MDO7897888.1 type II secretion system protein GspM [Pseudomonas sp. K18]